MIQSQKNIDQQTFFVKSSSEQVGIDINDIPAIINTLKA